MRPTAHRSTNTGINFCCCQCCTCLNLRIFQTEPGLIKIGQAILGFLCQSLAINFGLPYAATIGPSYHGFLTTSSWCLMTTFILICCYLFSTNSYSLLRQSLFETLYNAIAACSYISASSYLAFAVNTFLYPLYLITPYYQVYPAMSAAYMLGTLAGLLHAYDAYRSYKYLKGYR